MSRTDKDTPYWVVELNARTQVEVHHGCQHSVSGGYPIWRTEIVEHGPDWHYENRYLVFTTVDDENRGVTPIEGSFWLPADEAKALLVEHGLTRWQADYRIEFCAQRKKVYVYGPWTEKVAVKEFRTRECDLDSPMKGRARRYTCHYEADHDFEVWSRNRRGYSPPSKERRRLGYFGPERAHVRDTLRAAAADWNTYGETDIETIDRPSPTSDWYGGYWD